MKHTEILRDPRVIAFIILTLIAAPLLSYTIVLHITPLSIDQQSVVSYVQSHAPFDTQDFTPEEISHLDDVYLVMLFSKVILVVSLVGIVIVSYTLRTSPILPITLRLSGIVLIVFILLLSIFVAVAFTTVFALFHQLFFSPGTWTFPSSSALIQRFPLDFFIGITKKILTGTLVIGALLIAASKVMNKYSKNLNNTP